MGKDVERPKDSKENPYRLSPEALRPPETGEKEWFENLVALQREGIDQGVMPQAKTVYLHEQFNSNKKQYYLPFFL